MLPECFLLLSRCRETPHGLHLLAAVFSPHVVVIEHMPVLTAFGRLGRPQNGFCGVRKTPAPEVGRRVSLFPSDVVQDSKSQLHHRHPHTQINVDRSGNPNGSCRLQDPVAFAQP